MSTQELELVDEIRRRLNATYDEAVTSLREANGDLPLALALTEKRRKEQGENLVSAGGDLVEEIRRLAEEGEIRKVRLLLGQRPLGEFSVSLSRAGAVVFSLLALLLTKCVIEVIRD